MFDHHCSSLSLFFISLKATLLWSSRTFSEGDHPPLQSKNDDCEDTEDNRDDGYGDDGDSDEDDVDDNNDQFQVHDDCSYW